MLLLLFLALLMLDTVVSFASWFASDYCKIPLKAGEIIMNHEAVHSVERMVEVYRNINDKELKLEDGDNYRPGDILFCILGGPEGGELVFESNVGIFENSGCNQKRSSASTPDIVIPSEYTGPIEIWAGKMFNSE